MSKARKLTINLKETRYYQCISRCVRQMFLCGTDESSKQSFEHRKQWIKDRMQFLSRHFAIDICSYAIMSNHYHIVLKVNISWLMSLSQEDIISHWNAVFSCKPKMRKLMLYKAQNNHKEVKKMVREMRSRLMSISWFMSALNRNIAYRANLEENRKGRFWEGRFVSQPLLTESAILKCMAYVDLNPVRAGVAESIEQCKFTSIGERIRSLRNTIRQLLTGKKLKENIDKPYNNHSSNCSSFNSSQFYQPRSLLPFSTSTDEQNVITAIEYIQFVDLIGRYKRKDGKSYIKQDTPSILEYIGITIDQWKRLLDLYQNSNCQMQPDYSLKLRPL